jgi:hypothetical protein
MSAKKRHPDRDRLFAYLACLVALTTIALFSTIVKIAEALRHLLPPMP